LISNKPRVSLRKLPREGVSRESNRQIRNRRPRLDLRPRAHARERASADRRARECQRQGESALTERVQHQRGNRRLKGSEGVRAVQSRSDGGGGEVRGDPKGSKLFDQDQTWGRSKGIRGGLRGSESFDQDRTGEIRPGETDVHDAAPLLSAAVRSPELRQARARVAPGSPELGRGEDGATANSMAGKRP
jgi:hypothetical protein